MERKHWVWGFAIVVLVVAVVALAGYNERSSSSASVASAPTLEEVFDADRANTLVICKNMFTLLDQGWTSTDIYETLADGGAFDDYPGSTGHKTHRAMLKWCFTNAD
jgi:hypothetical protein